MHRFLLCCILLKFLITTDSRKLTASEVIARIFTDNSIEIDFDETFEALLKIKKERNVKKEVSSLVAPSEPEKTEPQKPSRFQPRYDSDGRVVDFPRTPLIMGSSLAVILSIATVIFLICKCREAPPNAPATELRQVRSNRATSRCTKARALIH